MVGSTLPSWMTVLLSGSIFLVIFGYFNHYVPKDQREKAKTLKKKSNIYFSHDCYIEYSTRVNPLCYCVIAALISLATIIVFFVSGDNAFINGIIESLGPFGYAVNALIAIVAFFVLSLFLILLACIGETVAISETKDHYWRVYGVFMESKDK